jgi:D-tagatose-1,6-bisphosphate aldolase subunit GatZ/KbaZ
VLVRREGVTVDASVFFSHLLRKRGEGKRAGIYSVCCANPIVIEASMDQARSGCGPLLVESTSNQVNQYGGYTGMKPSDFVAFVRDIASRSAFAPENLILGGDHLGPLVWKNMPESEAMSRAEELIAAYVEAGFTKIHIDTSMRLGGDPLDRALPDDVIAARGARLCAVAEATYEGISGAVSGASRPVYVIGSEVPTPGGAQDGKDTLLPTSPSAFRASYGAFERAFKKLELTSAWERIIAFVVQPGVEFNGTAIFDYDRSAAAELGASLNDIGRPFIFEAHSTDYQKPESLMCMVEDGVGILKVGPGLTFSLRECLIAMEHIERELAPVYGLALSNFADTLEAAMKADDSHWRNHYHGDEPSLKFQRRYSFFDRARYYLPNHKVDRSIKILLDNLERTEIALPLLSQYLPRSYDMARLGMPRVSPREMLKDNVRAALSPYSEACNEWSCG